MSYHPREYRKIIKFHGYDFGLMLLPVFSLSRPDAMGNSRLVFDWGKSLSHPRAKVGVAILNAPYGQFIKRLIYKGHEYTITNLRKCRSGRIAARVRELGRVTQSNQMLVNRLMEQELGE